MQNIPQGDGSRLLSRNQPRGMMKIRMNNRQIAKLLRSISAAYEIKNENRFKIIAYDRAATAVEHATSELKDLWDDNKLTSIPGIGTNIAGHLDELFRTGQVKHFNRVLKSLPPAMFEFLELPGVGPKTAFKLCQKLKIHHSQDALTKLSKAIKQGKIKVLKGFGEQSEQAIFEALGRQKPKKGRMSLPFAWELAQKIISYMKEEKAALRVEPLGSLRRMTATVGDIDLAVVTKEPKPVIDHFVKFPEKRKVVAAGENTARIVLKSGHQIDLKTQKPESYGALLQHYTGSKQHNIHLREIAQKKGWSLSEHGIKKKGKTKEFASEKEFYRALGMDWIPPELREDSGEIEAALLRRSADQGGLPNLVKLNDIKGDLHLHSDFPIEPNHDEGADSMEVMIKKAIELDYEYLGFSEHNPSLSQHTDRQTIDLIKRKKEKIEKLKCSFKKSRQKQQIRLLNGLEVDIRPNGNLAISDKAIAILDYVIAAIHTSFIMPREKMTQRVLAALEHPKVLFLAHPTGRMLGQREGYELDWEKVFAFCKKHDKWLEINAWPNRLDLPDVLARAAVKNGVKMIINTDSHALDQMALMAYGLAVARRGWATKEDIINTLPWDEFNVKLKNERR